MCANAGIVEAGRFLEVNEGEPKCPNLKTLDIDLNGTLFCNSLFLIVLLGRLTLSSNQVGNSLYAEK